MITLLTGDNSFEIEQYVKGLIQDFDGEVEKIDADSINLNNLPDVLMGVSLFSQKRLIIIRQLSQSSSIWKIIADWLDKISDDITLILIEPTLDKRTGAHKAISKSGSIKEFTAWRDRDYLKAEEWVSLEAKKRDLKLSKENARLLVNKIGVDQWQLFHAVEKLSDLGDASAENIEDFIDSNPLESSLNLLYSAVRGDISAVQKTLMAVKQNEDAYRIFALLSSQAFNMLTIYSSEKSDDISKDFSIHPFVISKLSPLVGKIGKGGVSKLVQILVKADDDMKSSKAEPWIIIESALLKITAI